MKIPKLTNRSIHTIKKKLMREEAAKITVDHLNNSDSKLTNQNEIWEIDYKSTSDEEDNDSSDEDEYGKVQYPKPRIASAPGSGGEELGKLEEEKESKKEKKVKDDVVSQIIQKDRKLVIRDLEARLKRIRTWQANIKKYRKQSNITSEEFSDFDKTEDYSWWQGVDDPRGVYFALGTKFSSRYNKGDQLFNCYGRRNNRFLLVNYGFCLRYNKYNSVGFKVFVQFKENAEQ